MAFKKLGGTPFSFPFVNNTSNACLHRLIKWRRLEEQGAYEEFDRDPELRIAADNDFAEDNSASLVDHGASGVRRRCWFRRDLFSRVGLLVFLSFFQPEDGEVDFKYQGGSEYSQA